MKKLKIYGEKEGKIEFIADVYVKDTEVVVEAQNPEVRVCLEELVKGCFTKYGLPRGTSWDREEEGRTIHEDGIVFLKPGDPKFLETLEYRLRGESCSEYKFTIKAWKMWQIAEE